MTIDDASFLLATGGLPKRRRRRRYRLALVSALGSQLESGQTEDRRDWLLKHSLAWPERESDSTTTTVKPTFTFWFVERERESKRVWEHKRLCLASLRSSFGSTRLAQFTSAMRPATNQNHSCHLAGALCCCITRAGNTFTVACQAVRQCKRHYKSNSNNSMHTAVWLASLPCAHTLSRVHFGTLAEVRFGSPALSIIVVVAVACWL